MMGNYRWPFKSSLRRRVVYAGFILVCVTFWVNVVSPALSTSGINTRQEAKTVISDELKHKEDIDSKTEVNIHRQMNETCPDSLALPYDEILNKISSYKFPEAKKYLNKLFPPSYSTVMPEYPVFVSALSSNHFKEGLAMIHNFNTMIRKGNPQAKLHIFDLGLTAAEIEEIQNLCQCTIRNFPFEEYPSHIRILRNFSWKPIVVQLLIKEHPFVVWMDADIRFITSNISYIIETAKKVGVLVKRSGSRQIVIKVTMKDTFDFLNEEPCLFRNASTFHAGFFVIHATQFEIQYFLKPWISCALSLGCLALRGDVNEQIRCPKSSMDDFQCHRFDQAILSILVNRLFHNTINEYLALMDNTRYFITCRGCKTIGVNQKIG